MNQKKIILASQSPRRRELLSKIGMKFEVIPADIDEIIEGKEFSNELIENLAVEKVMEVKKNISYPAIIIGSDTVVVVDGKVLGKPENEQNAFNMLKMLSGKTHQVISGIAVIDSATGRSLVDHVVSNVTFRELSDSEIKNYIKTGEPMDKAGAYAIQGLGSVFIERIDGDFLNVVGLPLLALTESLKKFGITVD